MIFDLLERNMKKQDKFPSGSSQIILHLIFVFIMAFAVLWGMLMFSANEAANSFFRKTDFFWIRLIWFEAVTAIFWYAFTGNYLKKILSERKQTGAIHIITGSVFFKLAMYSLIIWLIGCFLPISASWQGWVFLAQFIVIIYTALLLYLLPHMPNFQDDGMETFPAGVKTPDDLVMELQILETETGIPENEKKILKRSREKIKYSVTRFGKISISENYKELVADIESLSKISTNKQTSQLAAIEDRVMKKILLIQNECKK